MTKWSILLFATIVMFITPVNSQDDISIILRDKDVTKFQRVKLYINVLDKDGKPIINLDSSSFSISEKNTGESVIPKIENFYSSSEPMAILFAIDVSYSMEGAPLMNVKEGMLRIINDFRKDDKMGIGYFHDDFFKQASFDTDRDVLRNNINSLHTGGSSTELYKATIESINWLQSLPEPRRKILVVISDGEDNGNKYRLEDVLNQVKSSGITVFCIGSTAVDKGFLQNMEKIASSSPDGKYYKINKPEDIKDLIPTLYERVKQEYVLTYFSYSSPSTDVSASIQVKLNNKSYSAELKYKSPPEIIENAPSLSFWSTKEFLYGSVGAGALIVLLAVFMFINMRKKKQFRLESEAERKLREEEAIENQEKYDRFKEEYDRLLDRLENQMTISQTDKENITNLEKQLESTGQTIGGASSKIDYKRRTMILQKADSEVLDQTRSRGRPSLYIKSGASSGTRFDLTDSETVLGRMNASVVFNDDTVSRRHARIMNQNGSFIIEDLDSTNGTYLNNIRITRANLSCNDIIRLGNVEILFTC